MTTIRVSRKHIKSGARKSAFSCPVALACNDEFHFSAEGGVKVDYTHIDFPFLHPRGFVDLHQVDLPMRARVFIRVFDFLPLWLSRLIFPAFSFKVNWDPKP